MIKRKLNNCKREYYKKNKSRITDKHHFTWTHLVEAKDMISWIGAEGFPLTIVVDKKGIVRYAIHGTNETTRAELLKIIKEAEAE